MWKKINSKQKRQADGPYGIFYIYALIDPRNKEVFYVGRSKEPEHRLKQHIQESYNGSVDAWGFYEASDTEKHKKIVAIRSAALFPEIKILDQWEVESVRDANRLEDAWIAEMIAKGYQLTNFSLSRRQNPAWYRNGFSKSPKLFIKRIKTGEIQPVGKWIITPEGKKLIGSKNKTKKTYGQPKNKNFRNKVTDV